MSTETIRIDPASPDEAALRKAAAAVRAGRLVAFPTETVYGIACRAHPDYLKMLDRVKQRPAAKHYTLHIHETAAVDTYLPKIGLKGRKLIENAWPGPLTVVFELTNEQMAEQRYRLGKKPFRALYGENSIGIRCPSHRVAQLLLKYADCPVVAPSANVAGNPPATDAQQVSNSFTDKIDMVLDAGPCEHAKSSTVVKLTRGILEMLRQGVYTRQQLAVMARVTILFVCTGNTCRSPIAEALCRQYLAKKLGCKVDELESMGYKLVSAGTMGVSGIPATPEAVAVCAPKGIDISAYKSQALSEELVKEADIIFVMTASHMQKLGDYIPEALQKCTLLDPGGEVPDPVGGSQRDYDNCARLIESAVNQRVEELIL